jgi:hypothetical protein
VQPETILAVAACAAAAIWIDLGNIHHWEDGDSMIPVLVSRQRWLPYMWEQDRFGMLMPLLAMPFKDLVLNLLVQRGLFLFFGFCSFLAAARWAFDTARWQLLGLAGAALWVGLAPERESFGYLGDEPYGPALLLSFWALIVARGTGRRIWRWPLAAVLMLAGHWVNAAMCLYLVPLVAARGLAIALGHHGEARRQALLDGAVQTGWGIFGGLTAYVANRSGLTGPRATTLNPLPIAEWPKGWMQLGRNLWTADLKPQHLVWVCLALGAAGAAAMVLSPRWRRETAEPARILGAIVVTSTGYFLLAGSLSHVAANLYAGRYVEPMLPFLEVGLLALVFVPLSSALAGWPYRAACAVAAAGVMVGSAWTFGPPAPSKIRPQLDGIASLTPEVVSARCTHVAGWYWMVWPTVMMTNQTLYERGEARQVFGISDRSGPTRELAMSMPADQVRICVPLDDRWALGWLRQYGYPPLVLLEHGPRLAVLGVQGAQPPR